MNLLVVALVVGIVTVCYARTFDRINAEHSKGTWFEYPAGRHVFIFYIVGFGFITLSVWGIIVLAAG